MNGTFHLWGIVEGDGDKNALPSLIHRIWKDACSSFLADPTLNIVVKPQTIKRGRFFDIPEERKNRLKMLQRWAAAEKRKCGVVVLLDAEAECYKKVKNLEEIRDDIETILQGVPKVFALAEKGYESWLVEGLWRIAEVSGNKPGDPEEWLKKHYQKFELSGPYKKTAHQKKLTGKFDIDLAAEKNCSFRRFRAQVLALLEKKE